MDANPLPKAGIVIIALALCAMLALLSESLPAVLGGSNGPGICGSPLTVGATEYGGPGDPSSGTVGASGVSLLKEPDSYAELGERRSRPHGLGGLAYETPLAISWKRASVIAYKRDIGVGVARSTGAARD